MAPFTGGMVTLNAALFGYAEGCIMVLLFGFWPAFVAWLVFRKVVKPWLDVRQDKIPYIHVEPQKAANRELTFPGADRLKLPQVIQPGTVVPRQTTNDEKAAA
jgi:hypothetical protein